MRLRCCAARCVEASGTGAPAAARPAGAAFGPARQPSLDGEVRGRHPRGREIRYAVAPVRILEYVPDELERAVEEALKQGVEV